MRMNLLESRYNGKCSIEELRQRTDPDTNVTSPTWVEVAYNKPCRLVIETLTATRDISGAPSVSQSATLLIDPTVHIRPGSRIMVEHDGRVSYYKSAGIAAVYLFHQEVPLLCSEEWA